MAPPVRQPESFKLNTSTGRLRERTTRAVHALGTVAGWAILLGLFSAMLNVARGQEVDPAVIGTWRLQYAGPVLYWTIRREGTYRLHSPVSVNSGHRGSIKASNGTWNLASPEWQDGGTYQVSNQEWVAVGKLGPGTWHRVWHPQDPQQQSTPPTPACGLLTLAEVALALDAPVDGYRRHGGPEEGCKYQSILDKGDELRLRMSHGSTVTDSFTRKRQGEAAPVDVPGVGRGAYATVSRNGILTLTVLGNEGFDASRHANMGTLFALTLRLRPAANLEDLPVLSNLAKLAFQLLGRKKATVDELRTHRCSAD